MMAWKFSLYNIIVGICIIMIVVLNSATFIRKSWSINNIPIGSSSIQAVIRSNISNSNKSRRFAIFSSSIHSKLRSYIFYTPIAAAAWQRLGYEVIVVFVGDWLSMKHSNPSIIVQFNLTERFLQRLNVHIIHFQTNRSHSIKLSQLIRIFNGYLPNDIVNDDDYILTSDSDIIPIQKRDYEIIENSTGFIYNAFCCGSFQRRNISYQMFPLSHICLKKKIWRDLFLQSIQRKELLKSDIGISNKILLSNTAPYSFDMISLYTRHEFPYLYDSDMTKGDAAWYMDQVYVSMLINEYLKNNPNIRLDKRYKRSFRLDPNLPSHAWEPERFKEYGDAHIIHDEIFDSYRWALLKKLLYFLFNPNLASDFDFYYKQFTLTLHNKPDEY